MAKITVKWTERSKGYALKCFAVRFPVTPLHNGEQTVHLNKTDAKRLVRELQYAIDEAENGPAPKAVRKEGLDGS